MRADESKTSDGGIVELVYGKEETAEIKRLGAESLEIQRMLDAIEDTAKPQLIFYTTA